MPKLKRTLDAELVVRNAAEIADEVGLERLTITMLADRLNVRPPSIYYHVKSLDDLYNQLTLQGLKSLAFVFESSIQGKRKNQIVSALSHAVRDFARANPTLFLCAGRRFSLANDEYLAAVSPLTQVLDNAFSPLQLSSNKSQISQFFLRCLLNGFITLEANEALTSEDNNDELFKQLIKMANLAINKT